VRRARAVGVITLSIAICASAVSAEAAVPRWKKKLYKTTRNDAVSVRVMAGKKVLFARRSAYQRIPASNEKLLLSMALLDRLGPKERFPTTAHIKAIQPPMAQAGKPDIRAGVVASNLWVTGRGDPTIARNGSEFGHSLAVRPTWVGYLARKIKNRGIRRIEGRIVGVQSYFRHDWFAPGWKSEFPREQVALPSALGVDGNTFRGRHVGDPEYHFARALTKKLESMGVSVHGGPRSGTMKDNLATVGRVWSRPLKEILRHMNRHSSNFFAEVLGKALAVASGKRPGTISGGAAALRRWVADREVSVSPHDGSGLSYSNRVSARGIVRLLRHAEDQDWGKALFNSLPKGGRGTLDDRLEDVGLRAKTGTLDGVSALSGWLWLRRSERWSRFSILVTGHPTWEAKGIEDRIVRLISAHR
jgi:D-alanyl-D-alanine carboxypeptidase